MRRASYPYQPPAKLQCRGNTYSQLSSERQSEIYVQLVQRCHSLETLRREGVILDVGQPPHGAAQQKGLCVVDFAATPDGSPAAGKRKAVAIACETAEAEGGGNEPVSICVLDFLTGQTLVDSFVAPSRPISDWRTHVHGTSAKSIEAAVKGNNCLRGWQEARAKLFEYVDNQTVLVGYMICGDLEALRVFHKGIVDAQILAADAIFGEDRGPQTKWPIDRVCMGLASLFIRQNATPENQKHDPLEDALASREIVLRFIQQPRKVKEWGNRERHELFGESPDEQKAKGNAAMPAKRASGKRRAGAKGSSSSTVNQKANRGRGAKQNRTTMPSRAAGASVPVAEPWKELKMEDSARRLKKDEPQNGSRSAAAKANQMERSSKGTEESGSKTTRGARRRAKKEAEKAAEREAELRKMVRELEEQSESLRLEDAKQSAKAHWEVKHKAERKARWVEQQRS
ncbi:hypothetical protein Trco_006856 [Trichoderma cornu-damae]|uniref:Exonuclease domain-containing protein n=1 Tax=Trichoderma cornu-damae TaxID=654480 RepID=A0A9P8TU51_9HYPO|nr:hypothetical protein Trco_006856 [Trichoderma cornu-damae]